jgi:hypothetical protein
MSKPRNLNPDLINEAPFLLAESLRHIPQATSVAQIRDWIYRGILPNKMRRVVRIRKRRVFLECVQLSDGLGTSYAAYVRFIEKLNR